MRRKNTLLLVALLFVIITLLFLVPSSLSVSLILVISGTVVIHNIFFVAVNPLLVFFNSNFQSNNDFWENSGFGLLNGDVLKLDVSDRLASRPSPTSLRGQVSTLRTIDSYKFLNRCSYFEGVSVIRQ